MMATKTADSTYREGDEVVLARGTYQGTRGTFLRLREDINWADIRELDGSVNIHPVIWLAHADGAIPSTGRGVL